MYIFSCPHCKQTISVEDDQLNCRIFRCGIYKTSFEQINPHLDKKSCDFLKSQDLIYGCGKPFQLFGQKPNFIVEKCDYI